MQGYAIGNGRRHEALRPSLTLVEYTNDPLDDSLHESVVWVTT